MTTLSKRATPSQTKMLKIIEGAVLNTADAHNQKRDLINARSIAKRAAGTLSAQWPEVLAANRLSDSKPTTTPTCQVCERRAATARASVRRMVRNGNDCAPWRGSSYGLRRSPLLILWNDIKRELWKLKRDGDIEKYETLVDVLRRINSLMKQEAQK